LWFYKPSPLNQNSSTKKLPKKQKTELIEYINYTHGQYPIQEYKVIKQIIKVGGYFSGYSKDFIIAQLKKEKIFDFNISLKELLKFLPTYSFEVSKIRKLNPKLEINEFSKSNYYHCNLIFSKIFETSKIRKLNPKLEINEFSNSITNNILFIPKFEFYGKNIKRIH